MTKDDRVILASEAGTLHVPESEIISKGRLEPGKMFVLDLEAGKILQVRRPAPPRPAPPCLRAPSLQRLPWYAHAAPSRRQPTAHAYRCCFACRTRS